MKSKLEAHASEIQQWLTSGMSFRDMARRLNLVGTLADHETVRRFITSKGLKPGGATPDATPPGDATPPDATPPDATSMPVAPGVVPRDARRCPAPDGIAEVVLAEAESRTAEALRRVNVPPGYSLYPCPTQFFPWAEPEAKEWFQIVTPGGGETTLSESELLEKFGPRATLPG